MSKKNKKPNIPPGYPPPQQGGYPPPGGPPPGAPRPPPPPAGKRKRGMPPPPPPPKFPPPALTPDQMKEVKLNAEIRVNEDRAARLRKLRSPCGFRGCLLNLILWVLLTLIIVFTICYIMVDKFEFVTLVKDMLEKLGVNDFFRTVGRLFSNIFKKK